MWKAIDRKSSAAMLHGEPVLRLTGNISFNCEEAARKPVTDRRIVGRCGDVESPEVRPTEGASSYIPNWHFNYSINFSVRSDPHDASAKEPAIPQESLRVYGRAIGQSAGKMLQEWLLICNVAGLRIKVKAPDHVRQRVRGVKVPAIGAPGQSVRDPNIPTMNASATVRINAVKYSVLATSFPERSIRIDVVSHGADPKRSAWISARVIVSDPRPSFQHQNRIVTIISLGLPKHHARSQRDHQDAIPVGESECGHRFVKNPGSDAFVRGRETMNEEAIDVHPIYGGMSIVPKRAFAAAVSGVRHADWV